MDLSNLKKVVRIIKLQEIALNSVLCAKLLRRMRKKLRRWWIKPHLLPEIRDTIGAYATICHNFQVTDHEEFELHFRMPVACFENLYTLLRASLQKQQCVRIPIPPEIRLALTLHYLGHGGSARLNSLIYRVGKSTYYEIIAETCKVIATILVPLYLRLPDRSKWLQIAKSFENKWNFPHCIGALDGKHVRLKKPPHGGSVFFNYKRFHSIVLMAISDADCRFIWYTVGDGGSFSDSSVFNNSSFYEKLTNNQLQIPKPTNLPNSNKLCPYVFVADEIFGISTNLMKPYNRRLLRSVEEKIFNYRLSRARFTIESAFGILCSKWQLLNSALGFNLSTNRYIVSACICLHNLIIINNRQDLQDDEDIRREVEMQNANDIVRNPAIIRRNFTQYFVNEGSVPWQNNYVGDNLQDI